MIYERNKNAAKENTIKSSYYTYLNGLPSEIDLLEEMKWN